jgi:hypothetical protein
MVAIDIFYNISLQNLLLWWHGIMKKQYLLKIAELMNKFEYQLSKLAQQPIVSQNGTTELFFGDENKQRSFNAAVQSGNLAKFVNDAATKLQKTVSFDLKASAEPNKGPAWSLNANPPTLKSSIFRLLDTEFQRITGKNMTTAQQTANAAAKAGNGSGTLNIASLSAEVD